MSLSSARVPLAIASGIICLAIGLGAGAAAMMGFGYKPIGPPTSTSVMGKGSPPAVNTGGPPPGMFAGGKAGAGGGRGGSFGGTPSSKAQLAALVTKLDQLSQKSLTVELTTEQKKKAHEILKGLADAEDLSDDDAKKRLDDLLELLKDKKGTIEAAGFRWPGGPAPARPADAPNPFKEEANAKHLKSLDGTLTN